MDKTFMECLINFFKYYNFDKKLYNIRRNDQDYIASHLTKVVVDEIGKYRESHLMNDLAEYLKINIKSKKHFTFMGVALAILKHRSKVKHPKYANEYLKQRLAKKS